MTFKIAVANEKGGVAKTTTTISLGGAIAEAGKRVAVVDLDAQANLTLALGLKPSEVKRSIARVVLHSDSPADVVRQTAVNGLDLIPSNSEMGLAERFLPVRQNYQSVLRNALQDWEQHDYIIFDCPPALGAVTMNALTAADMLIIPTQAEYFSVYALKNMMAAIREAREVNNPSLTYKVLVTMLDKRNRTHKTLIQQLGATFRHGLLDTSIEMDTKLRESSIAGVPITSYSSRSRSADQYRELAQEILEYVEKVRQRETVH